MRHTVHLAAGAQNQDRARVVVADGRCLVVLADGAGGLAGGEVAADAVVAGCVARLGRPDLDHWLYDLDEALFLDPLAGETTAVVARLDGNRIVGASVGDSGAWWVTADAIVDLTERQVRKPLLGSGRASVVGFDVHLPPGVLLVASDGLLKYTTPDRIAAVVRSTDDLERRALALVDLVRLRSGALSDDTGLVLVAP